MGLTPLFDLASASLHTQQLILQTTGHNLANVDRAHYSRQEVLLANVPPVNVNGLAVGMGVKAESVRQIVDPLLEAQLLAARGRSTEAEARHGGLSRLERLFTDIDGGGLQEAFDAFFAAADDVALHPQGVTERTVFLTTADSLAARIRARSERVGELQREMDHRVVAAVPRINGLLDDIARLNGAIFQEEVGRHTANDLRDERREALTELSKLVGNTQFEAEAGITVVGPDGLLLVEGQRVNHIVADRSTAPALMGLDGYALTRLGFQVGPGDFVAFSDAVDGGEVGGLLAVRDGDLPAVAASLDQMATGFRTAVNAVHSNGEDLDGNPGGALFGGAGAADLTVLITDPRRVAASAATIPPAPNSPEDNRNALALAGLGSVALDGTDPALGNADLGGQTVVGFLASVVAAVGSLTEAASVRAEAAEGLTVQITNQRAATSGVSTNEELLTLLDAQRAFQAAATLVTVATSTVDAVLDMVR